MVKRTAQQNDPSGIKRYVYKEDTIIPMTMFIYEIAFYKHWSNGSSLLETKYLQSSKLLKIPFEQKKYEGFTISRYCSLIGAPEGFINELKLPSYETFKNKQNERKNRHN